MIDNIFHFINLALVAAIFFYLFIRYALPGLRREMRQREENKRRLQEHYHRLMTEERDLLKYTQSAHQQQKKLREKVLQWQQSVHTQNSDVEYKRSLLYKMVQEKRLIQKERKAYMRIVHQATCASIQAAEKKIYALMQQDEQAQQDYGERALVQLVKGKR